MANKAIWLTTAALAAMTATGAVYAQDADEDGAERTAERIVVTAQKREQEVIDVPINLSAFDAARLQELNIERFDELAEFVPGLEIQMQSPNTPSFAIRGISTDNTASNVETRVSIFQDGVSASRTGGSVFELFDLERVEVAKGPQSTLFGRAALIGAINVIQNKPVFEPEAGGALEIGEDGYHRVEGFVNAPIIDDVLALRVAAVDTDRDGWVENIFGDDLMARDTTAVRASLRFQPTNSVTLDLIANWQEDEASGTAFKSGTVPTPGGDASPFTPAALNTFGGFQGDRPLGTNRELESYTAIATWEATDALSFTSISGFREFDNSEIFDPDGSVLEFIIGETATEGEQITQELRANYDAGGRISAFAGFNYFREYGSRFNLFATNEAVTQQLNLPLLLEFGGFPDVASAEDDIARLLLANVIATGGGDPSIVPTLPLDVVNAQLAAVPVSPPLGPVDLDDPANPYP
ncbi:MAG: TonB-dependent receptor, partial [Caulobacterales bacterium]|nr:TonB-dependent receptor [Caulobacterales bacterium]